MTFDLFCELNATDEQLDFPILYTSAKEGWATLELDEPSENMKPLLDTILHRVLPPVADPNRPFQMLVTMLDYDSYVGRIANGRIFHGRAKVGDSLVVVKRDGKIEKGKVTKIFKFRGLNRIEADRVEAGDIASIAGFSEAHVADTLADPNDPQAVAAVKIDEPTISMYFAHNSSPLAGKSGARFLTSRHIRERLFHEAMMNVGIRVEPVPAQDRLKVSGRGELHLSILIETMRREGYELEVSRPEVIIKEEDGEKLEPVEEAVIEVDPGYQGAVIEALGSRKAEMKNMMTSAVGTIRLEFLIPSRSLLGFRSELLMMTRGTGIMYQNFYDYQQFKGEIPGRKAGVLISQTPGHAVAYALWGLQDRGEILTHPGDELYEGMIVGVNNKGKDLVVNAIRSKKLTNMRASGSDEGIHLVPPREMTLEFALEFIENDELVEITPKNIRLRKRYLTDNDRRRQARR
jgi:GTP-binding protein